MRVLMSAPSGLGHVNPLVPLVIAFLDRGDDVILATAEPSYGRVRALGIQATEIGLAAPEAHDLALERFPELRDLPGCVECRPRCFRGYSVLSVPKRASQVCSNWPASSART